jgi:hypothetical protein
MKCTRNREKKVQLLVFWDDQEMDAILLIIGIVYGVANNLTSLSPYATDLTSDR